MAHEVVVARFDRYKKVVFLSLTEPIYIILTPFSPPQRLQDTTVPSTCGNSVCKLLVMLRVVWGGRGQINSNKTEKHPAGLWSIAIPMWPIQMNRSCMWVALLSTSIMLWVRPMTLHGTLLLSFKWFISFTSKGLDTRKKGYLRWRLIYLGM